MKLPMDWSSHYNHLHFLWGSVFVLNEQFMACDEIFSLMSEKEMLAYGSWKVDSSKMVIIDKEDVEAK